jgi:NADH-quinone oxidoreductase subunit L
MTLPLQVLGGLTVVVGFLGLPAVMGTNLVEKFLEPLTPEVEGLAPTTFHLSHATEWTLMILSVAIAALGWWTARTLYQKDASWTRVKGFVQRNPGLYTTVFNKYYVDEFYDKTVGAALRGVSAFCYKIIDGIFIEGPVNLSGFFVELTGSVLRFVHNGNLRTYALHIVLGVAILLWLVF